MADARTDGDRRTDRPGDRRMRNRWPRALGRFALALPMLGLAVLGLPAGAARAQSGLPPVDRPEPAKPPRPAEEPTGTAADAARLRRDTLSRASAPALQAEMALERRLLAEDLLRYTGLRESERQRWLQVDDLKTEIDVALAADELLREPDALSEVQVVEARLESAVGEAENATRRARELRFRMVERVRKIQLLESELGRLVPVEETLSDPLSGRWEVTYRPDLLTGVFDLVLDGTQVSGRYRLSNERRGSLRGRFTGRELHLERVDRELGFDAVFDGTLDLEKARITGFWRPTDLSGGAAGGGDWWAERPAEEPAPEPSTEAPGETEEEGP